ncbi:MAG TPA: YeeE/YedE thiosulfate transporter family protein [Anaerovoracaceae bacterium]|nr:YeeE/YedE thiosulfate transporter family protein [Anaerovoracaceae bacterium]
MSEDIKSIQRSGGTRAPRKPKKSQIPYGVAVLILMIVIGIALSFKSGNLAMFWIFGSCFGFVLQKSRFCFTASFRDPWISGSTSITKAIMIALAVTTIGFTAIKYGAFANGLPIPGMGYVVPVGISTMVGGTMFGTGMVIAGGCASGTLMRVGEGFMMQMLALVFFIAGALLGAFQFGFWKINFISNSPKIFLPDYFGWFGAVVLQLLLIGCIYIFADKWQNKKMGI